MRIIVNDQIQLTEFRPEDKEPLALHLHDRDIYERTLSLPYPYTPGIAETWLASVAKTTEQQGRPVQWAIRDASDYLIGGIGFDGLHVGKSYRADLGYWLAKPFWARGIMTAVVARLCQHGFEDLGLVKICAYVFLHNPASARVLENCGFQQEGLLHQHFRKDGRMLDARLYGLVKVDSEPRTK